MIVKIQPKELDAMKYTCATCDFLCHHFTIENNPNLLQVEILGLKGEEVLPQYAIIIGRMFEQRLEIERLSLKNI